MLKTFDRDRLVFGTNFGGWDTPSATDDFAASLTPNAEKLLRLDKADELNAPAERAAAL